MNKSVGLLLAATLLVLPAARAAAQGLFIGNGDLVQWRLLNTKAPGPKCPTCPRQCSAGSLGTCGPIP